MGTKIPKGKKVAIGYAPEDKTQALKLARQLRKQGFKVTLLNVPK